MNAPAGWYADPRSERTMLRWWDGDAWTDEVRVRPTAGIQARKGPRSIWRTVMITLAVVATSAAGLFVLMLVLVGISLKGSGK
jgi:hypothetical protein